MITSELISYIKSQLDAGMTEMQIGTILKANGWIEADIHEAFSTIYPAPAQPVQVAPVVQQAPEIIQMTEPMYVESFKPIEYTRPRPEPIQPVQMFESVQVQPTQPIQMTQPAQVMQPEPIMMQAQPIVNPVVMQPVAETVPQMQTQTMPSMQAQSPYQQPVQQNIYMQQPAQQVQSTSGRAKKFILPIIVLILLLAVSGGAYAYFTGYFTPLEKITSEAFQAMYSANSATFDVTTSIDASGLLKGEDVNALSLLPTGFLTGKTSITTKGAYDSSDAANKKFSSTILIDAGTVSAAAEIRAINGVLYAQITKTPTIAMLPILTSLEKQWVSFPYNTAQSADSTPMMIPGFDPKILNELTPAQKTEFYKITNNAHFIKVTQKLDAETINDVSSYHFMFDLDREGIIAYLNDIKTYIREVGKNDSKLSSFDPTTYAKDLENVHDFKGEAWIGKKDKLLHKFDISMTVIDSNTEKDGIKIGMVALFDKFNQPVAVETPASTITFNEFTDKLFSGMMSGDPDATGLLDGAVDATLDNANVKAQEAKIKSMITNMRASAELYWTNKDSYSGYCKSEKQTDPTIICTDAKLSFNAYAKLDNGKYFCADSTGFAAEISTLPKASIACPKK